MLSLRIVDKSVYKYNLTDDRNNYTIEMEFYDIEKKPDIGDYICINEELLNPQYDGYSVSYTFGNLENKYGKESVSVDDIDVIKYIQNEKEIYLKRLYG